ncbi:CAP domain-containing protein [Actinoplanes sp. Pm04-4]|uniref:CAP domain-containing protein n=1 Tax=Paractinoplanes pyxinae TaxID=2997416 RepID=A0ABT4ATE8_9ACTN|nr:CAP domain-containing protein [Actinoplanes pyxinae]MCY1137097.1 CAP domain-containing protein [Actinoplanes pyxinae]
MRTRHRRPTRTRVLVLATVAVGVLGAGAAGIASAQTNRHHPQAPAAQKLGAATRVTEAARDRRTHRPRPRPTATTTAPKPTTAAPTTAAPTTAVPTTAVPTTEAPTTTPPTTTPPPASTAPPATTAPVTTPPPASSVIDQVLAHINAARTANNLTPLTLNANLTNASQAHNALMVGGCGLSHQCPGEAGLGERFTAAGVSWNSAGENIGQGNASNNDASIVAAANGLTDLMLAETPPNDGHRRNLLNPNFKRVGLAVTRGADGRVWFTQDFVN